MIVKENKKYIMFEKTILSMTLGWFMILVMVLTIWAILQVPKTFRDGIYPTVTAQIEDVKERIKKVEFNQKMDEYLILEASYQTVNWQADIDNSINSLIEYNDSLNKAN